MRNDCIFCSVNDNSIIKKTKHAVATYTNEAMKTGHVVVSLIEHLESFTLLSYEQAEDMFKLALCVSKALESLLDVEKVYIVASGDKDKHFHLHLLPKTPTDAPMGSFILTESGWRGLVKNEVSEIEANELVKKLSTKCCVD